MSTVRSRRAAILAAGLASFLEHGVAGASIEDVCARSGASVGSVYHHFAGKEGLAGAVFTHALADYQAGFLAALHRYPDDAEAGIRAVVRAHVRWCLSERPDYGRFLLFHGDAARAATDELARRNREFFGAVLAWWRAQVRRGTVREPGIDLVYALWLGAAQEYCRLQLAGRGSGAPEHDASALADGAWHALRTGPAGPTGPTEGER